MNSRERLRMALMREVPDRVPLTETGYWPETLERWQREGLPRNVDPVTYLGMDKLLFIHYNSTLGLKERTLAETGERVVKVDGDGAAFSYWKNRYGPPQPLDFMVKTEDDWFRWKERLTPGENRLGKSYLENYKQLRREDGFLCVSEREPCWKVLAAMTGIKKGLTFMLSKPQLIYDMIATYTQLLLSMYEVIDDKGVEVDGVWLRGDLAFKDGMFFSPALYKRLVQPHHKRIADFFKSKGIPVIQHIDGDVRQYIPLIIESGFNAIQPLESRAHNDVRELKMKWGVQIAFIGNISVEALSGSRKQVEEEVRSKVLKAKEGGGYVFHSDHSVPPTVSWENYCRAIRTARQAGCY